MKRWLHLFQTAAGACDTSTGFLLLFVPSFTLRMMRVSVGSDALELVRYIGVFVLGVGLSYLWVQWRFRLSAASVRAWTAQWQITVLIRGLVATFLVAEVSRGALQSAWLMVAATDASIAAVQLFGLKRGWFERVV